MVESRTGGSEGISPDSGMSASAPRNWAARHDLLLFFVLAYLLSWALWPLVILNPASSPLVPFGPLIAAVVVSLLAGGRKELWALLRQLARWRVHPIWYVIALVGPFVIAVAAAALAVAMGAPMSRSGAYADVAAVGYTLLSTMIIVGLRGSGLARFCASQAAASPRCCLGGIGDRVHLGSVASTRTGLGSDEAAASAAICSVGLGSLRDLHVALQQHERQSAHRDHLPRRHRYGGPLPVAGVLERRLSDRVVVHGWALRRARDHRRTCVRPETFGDEHSAI